MNVRLSSEYCQWATLLIQGTKYRVAQKLSHCQVSALNRHQGFIYHKF